MTDCCICGANYFKDNIVLSRISPIGDARLVLMICDCHKDNMITKQHIKNKLQDRLQQLKKRKLL